MTSPVTWPTVGHQLGPGQPLRQYAIGVFCDRPDITAEAVNYYKTGRGNGTHDHSVYYLHPGYLGQWQESHRDQGHSTLGIALAGVLGELWLHLPLNGNADDAGGRGLHGQLVGGASWGEGRNGGASVLLGGKSGHLRLPDGAVAALGDFTIAVWVRWENNATNARIFDFGSTDVAYMALCPHDRGTNQLRFFTSRNQFWAEQSVTAPVLPTGRWVHVAPGGGASGKRHGRLPGPASIGLAGIADLSFSWPALIKDAAASVP